jgi:hypothetical protein
MVTNKRLSTEVLWLSVWVRVDTIGGVKSDDQARSTDRAGESMTLDELSEVIRSCPDVTIYDVAYMIQKRQEELSQEEPNDDG